MFNVELVISIRIRRVSASWEDAQFLAIGTQ